VKNVLEPDVRLRGRQWPVPRVDGLEVVDGGRAGGLVAAAKQVAEVSVDVDCHLVPHPRVLVHVFEELLAAADVKHPVVDTKHLERLFRTCKYETALLLQLYIRNFYHDDSPPECIAKPINWDCYTCIEILT